jgi:uncharacterized membrane protein YgaE (UPF0421/DUF939 family)
MTALIFGGIVATVLVGEIITRLVNADVPPNDPSELRRYHVAWEELSDGL